ncbi:MAG: thioredoxin domain-containing protein [Candidatus Omnitrophica bacterium]|nr:thioredoxin domain-containing protein [Candidatus Omnitrophota bacterium]
MKASLRDQLFVLVLVVVASVFVGLTIMVQQTTSPVMKRLVTQQAMILTLQRKMEKQLVQGQAAVERASAAQPREESRKVTGLLAKQQELENRIAGLESKITEMTNLIKNARPVAPSQRQGPPSEDFTKVYNIDVAHSPIRGKKDALITIVEFVDFQCPFCTRFHPMIEEVLSTYPDKVNYVLKNFPLGFHKQAKPAAKAAFAAGEQGKYWEMVDALLENSRALSDEKFEELAKEIGLNVKKFKKDYTSKDAEWEKFIEADMMLAGKVAVRGTPTFFLNGKKTRSRDFASFRKEVDDILNAKK